MVSITHGGNARPLAAPDLPLPPTSPDHYDTENWETQIPASGSGDAGGHKDKGMELLHRAPELSLELVLPLLLSAPDPAFQVLLQEAAPGAPGAQRLPFARQLKSAGVACLASGRRATPALSADSSHLSPRPPSARPFPLTSQRTRRNSKERPRRPASCPSPNLAIKYRDRGRGAEWLALLAEGMGDGECGVAAHGKGATEFEEEFVDRSGV